MLPCEKAYQEWLETNDLNVDNIPKTDVNTIDGLAELLEYVGKITWNAAWKQGRTQGIKECDRYISAIKRGNKHRDEMAQRDVLFEDE